MGKCMDTLVDKLMATGNLETEELKELLKFRNAETTEYLNQKACMVRQSTKGNKVQIWGRIPISSYCKYDCKMCGIRRDNQFAKRFRMDSELILECCNDFAKKGVRNFLLESGDDVYYTEKRIEELLLLIQRAMGDCNIILSLGEKSQAAYMSWYNSGARIYLLRHGSANEQHFRKVYPSNMSLLLRKQNLWQLQKIGYRTGTGFLVGIPYQTLDNVVEDIQFIKSFEASVIDMGAFIPVPRTPFERERSGNGEMTLYIMAILRLMLPGASVLANPSLDCVLRDGRIKAFSGGADVLVADLEEDTIMSSYSVYERKNGRLFLPLDQVGSMKAKIEGMGLRVL